MKLIAHRGGAGHWPENTVYAFAKAMDTGWAGAELDIRLSKEGVPMVHHDAYLNPQYCQNPDGQWLAAGTKVKLSSLTAAELALHRIGEMRPGSVYADTFRGRDNVVCQAIPSLAQVLALAPAQPDFLWVLELKSDVLKSSAQPWQKMLQATLKLMGQYSTIQAVYCGFDWALLRAVQSKQPARKCWFTTHPLPWLGLGPWRALTPQGSEKRIKTMQQQVQSDQAAWFAGYDPANYKGSMAERIAQAITAAGGVAWFMHHADVTRESVVACHKAGILACAWSGLLRDASEYQRLADCGVDYFCTDLCRDALK